MSRLYLLLTLSLFACESNCTPKTTKIFEATLQPLTIYHETIGHIESANENEIVSLKEELLFLIKKSILTPVNPLTKTRDHKSYVKFFLPAHLKEHVLELQKNNNLVVEVSTSDNDIALICTDISHHSENSPHSLHQFHAHLPEKESALIPSQIVYIKIPLYEINGYLIPSTCIQKDERGHYLILSEENEKKHYVTICGKHKNYWIVKEGDLPSNLILDGNYQMISLNDSLKCGYTDQ